MADAGADSIEEIHDDWPEGISGYISECGCAGGCDVADGRNSAIGVDPQAEYANA